MDRANSRLAHFEGEVRGAPGVASIPHEYTIEIGIASLPLGPTYIVYCTYNYS